MVQCNRFKVGIAMLPVLFVAAIFGICFTVFYSREEHDLENVVPVSCNITGFDIERTSCSHKRCYNGKCSTYYYSCYYPIYYVQYFTSPIEPVIHTTYSSSTRYDDAFYTNTVATKFAASYKDGGICFYMADEPTRFALMIVSWSVFGAAAVVALAVFLATFINRSFGQYKMLN